jgi:hypothetical protein
MKPPNLISAFLGAVAAACSVMSADAAAEVWTGPLTNFVMLGGTDWRQSTNQDRLTTNVRLTRAMTRGMFNAASESGYTSFFSPADTEWAYGQLTNHASLVYTDCEDWNGHNPPSMVGEAAVLHLISDDIYLSIQFTTWGGSSGGFSYTRSTAVTIPPVTLLNAAIVGTNLQFSFVSVAGRMHDIESRTNVSAGVWQTRSKVAGDGLSKTVQFPINPGNREFFRLVTH